MNLYRYLVFCVLFINSCKENDQFNIDRHLVLLAYLDLENKEISDVSAAQIEQIINANRTRLASKNIYLTRIDYGGELNLSSSWKQIYYLHDFDTNFKFAFGSSDELCYHRIRVDCNHPLFESRYLVCHADSRTRFNINYILKELNISKIEAAKEIVREFMSMRIDSIHHLQLQRTRRYFNEGYHHLDSIRDCCLNALERLETDFKDIQQSKTLDLFESQFRGIWKIHYIEGNGPVQIEVEYVLMECMQVHPAGFNGYIQTRQADSLLLDYEGRTK